MLQNNSVMSYQCVLIFTESSILFTMSLHDVITVWFIIVWMLIHMHILISTICAMAQCPILIVTICAMSQCHSVIYLLSQYVQCHNVTVSYTYCHNMFEYLTVTMSHHGEVALICGVLTFSLMHTSESNPSLFANMEW